MGIGIRLTWTYETPDGDDDVELAFDMVSDGLLITCPGYEILIPENELALIGRTQPVTLSIIRMAPRFDEFVKDTADSMYCRPTRSYELVKIALTMQALIKTIL